jgi:hypothetical protein
MAPNTVTTVSGWANSNWSRSNDDPNNDSPVILNPDASALDMVSWGVGQLEQTVMLMEIIGTSKNASNWDPADVAGALRNTAEQALIVLRSAADKLFAQACEGKANHG